MADNGAMVRVTSSSNSGGSGADNGADPVRFRSHILAMVSAMESTGISYRAHMQSIGFQEAVSNGATAGLPGHGLRVEGVQIWSQNAGVVPCYRAHVQSVGWQGEVCDGDLAGTVGRGLRMEAIKLRLAQANGLSGIRYRAFVQGLGWQPFISGDQACTVSGPNCPVCSGYVCAAGTVGQGRRIEGLEIKVF